MLSVRMLGVLKISVDGQRVNDDLGQAGRLLSSYLFEYVGQVHRRERLVDMFWGRLDPMRARAAFNTALWRLRKLLASEPSSEGGQNLLTHGAEIVLEPAPWLNIDTHSFASAVKQRTSPQSVADTAPRLAALESAVQTYAGPFLEGEDADWILEERERLHSLYVRAESELVRCYVRSDSYEDAIAAARRILSADPFREGVLRSLALLFVLNGQRVYALRYYERWLDLFHAELGIEPMPQTIRLIEDIRSGGIFDNINALKGQFFLQSGHAELNRNSNA